MHVECTEGNYVVVSDDGQHILKRYPANNRGKANAKRYIERRNK